MDIEPRVAPRQADGEAEVRGEKARVLAVIPFSSGAGYRVPVRFLKSNDEPEDPLAVETIVYPDGEDPVLLPHPYEWVGVNGLSAPLACEIRTGDVLDPAHGKPGRPNEHREDAGLLSPQVVLSVSMDQYDGRVVIQTRDATGQLRRYRRAPEEPVDFTRPYKPPPRTTSIRMANTPAEHPQVFAGPYTSRTGAQFIFQERSKRGGRIPKNAPRFEESLPPLFDERTGDLLPYIVMQPGRSEAPAAALRSITTFSPTARKLPEVQSIFRASGVVIDEES